MSTTFYGVLGVGPDAGDDAIRAAYRERAKDHHPDVSAAPDAAEQFKRITAAKEVLLDPKERRRYDRLGHASYVDAHCDASLWAVDEGTTDAGSSASAPRSASKRTERTTKSRSGSGRGRSASRTESETDSASTGSTDASRGSRTRAETRANDRSRSGTSSQSGATSSNQSGTTSSRRSDTDGSSRSRGRGSTESDDAASSSARVRVRGAPPARLPRDPRRPAERRADQRQMLRA
ncbi:DnaJ domain-containing protein [Halosimplex aquaticum]